MTTSQIALLFAFVMLIGGGWVVYARSKGWGAWTLQAFGLVLLVQAIVVLAVTNALSKEILATLLGGVAGYIFGRGSGGAEGSN